MSTIRFEILSSLAETLDDDLKGDRVILEQETRECDTVRDILHQFSTRYPRFVEVVFDVRAEKQTERVNIFLNGRNLELENGLATQLHDGDTLTFVTPIIGG